MENIRIIDQDTALTARSAMADVQTELIESVAGIDRMISSLTAQRAVLIEKAHQWAQVTVDQVVPVGQSPARRGELAQRSFVAEIGCALRMPERSALKLIAESSVLVNDLPVSFTALAEGRIGYAHARVLADEVYGLDTEARHELESAVIGTAEHSTPSRLRARARRVRERMHPETLTARVKAAVEDRSMTSEPGRDGMGWLGLYLQAPLIAGIDDRIGQVAKRMRVAGDPRTIAQLRADIAAMLLLGDGTGPWTGEPAAAAAGADASADAGADADASDPVVEAESADLNAADLNADDLGAAEPHPGSAMEPLALLLAQVRPEMDVTVPVLTLLGKSETPATLNGVIPIDADTARRLAAAAPSFTRILTRPDAS